jgi:hypothetical protein
VSEDRGTARRLLRRFALGSGPLKRGSDRIEFAARVVLVAVVLAAVPVALAVATATATQTRSLADVQAATRHLVTATLLDEAAPADGGPGAPVAATWTAPSGAAREGIVRVGTAADVGTTVTIWVDEDGDVTTRPLADADVVARAIGYGLPTFLGTSALAGLGYLGMRRLLDRSRIRRWATDWAVVEPVWSRKVP